MAGPLSAVRLLAEADGGPLKQAQSLRVAFSRTSR
jgi:hypothetical protein